MTKTIIITVFIILLTVIAIPAQGYELIAGSSAAVSYREKNSTTSVNLTSLAVKRKAITEVLKRYRSPLVGEVDAFLDACTTYHLDCYLLPSIAGVESGFGRVLKKGTYNPFGWGRGEIVFDDFSKSIMTVGKALRENYIDRGADTIDKIGRIYCEGDSWSGKVQFFTAQFKEEEQKQLFFMEDTVQL